MDVDHFRRDSIRVNANQRVPPHPANWRNRLTDEPIYPSGVPDCSRTLARTTQTNSYSRNIWKNDRRAPWPENGNAMPINWVFMAHWHFEHTCDGFLLTKTLGAQKNFAESRSISAMGVVPKTIFGCGKYKHCKTLRDNRHGPHLLLKSMKKF